MIDGTLLPTTETSPMLPELSFPLVVKSYRELCNLLAIPIKTGNSKMSQMKDIENSVSLRREGNSFRIVCYLKGGKLVKAAKVVGSRKGSKWIEPITIGLLEVLSERVVTGEGVYTVTDEDTGLKASVFAIPLAQLAVDVGMVNGNYDGSEKHEEDIGGMNALVYSTIGSAFRSSLANLTRRNILIVNDGYIIDGKVGTLAQSVTIMGIKAALLEELRVETEYVANLGIRGESYREKLYARVKKELGVRRFQKVKLLAFAPGGQAILREKGRLLDKLYRDVNDNMVGVVTKKMEQDVLRSIGLDGQELGINGVSREEFEGRVLAWIEGYIYSEYSREG